jgi:hypothetical protein
MLALALAGGSIPAAILLFGPTGWKIGESRPPVRIAAVSKAVPAAPLGAPAARKPPDPPWLADELIRLYPPPAFVTPMVRPPGEDFLEFRLDQGPARQSAKAKGVRLTVERGRRGELGFATRVRIHAPGMKPHSFEGEVEFPESPRQIAVFRLSRSARRPAILLRSHSGGLYCCDHDWLAVPVGDRYRTIDMGESGYWTPIDKYPLDNSGDGVPDFLRTSEYFAHFFGSAGDAFPLPRIFNVRGSRLVNVTDRPEYRPYLANQVAKAEARCRDPLPSVSSGGCPAFVALAAIFGRQDAAWRIMLAVHRPQPDWPLPSRCPDGRVGGCEDGIPFRSYPEALLALLKEYRLVPSGWHPPQIAAG